MREHNGQKKRLVATVSTRGTGHGDGHRRRPVAVGQLLQARLFWVTQPDGRVGMTLDISAVTIFLCCLSAPPVWVDMPLNAK